MFTYVVSKRKLAFILATQMVERSLHSAESATDQLCIWEFISKYILLLGCPSVSGCKTILKIVVED